MTTESTIRRIAFLGNYLPRKCGIAIFTSDILEAVAAKPLIAPSEHERDGYVQIGRAHV